jgi:hypothetical protein
MATPWTGVAAVISATASGDASTDWVGLAAVITAAAAAVASVLTIIWNGKTLREQLAGQAEQQRKQQLADAEQQRKQQLADMISTAFGHFTGGTQKRSAGIAALRIVRAGSEDFDGDEAWKTYGPAIQGLLYSQLMYLYKKKSVNETEPHEAENIELMSDWLLGKDFQLNSHMKANLEKARRQYEAQPAADPRS